MTGPGLVANILREGWHRVVPPPASRAGPVVAGETEGTRFMVTWAGEDYEISVTRTGTERNQPEGQEPAHV